MKHEKNIVAVLFAAGSNKRVGTVNRAESGKDTFYVSLVGTTVYPLLSKSVVDAVNYIESVVGSRCEYTLKRVNNDELAAFAGLRKPNRSRGRPPKSVATAVPPAARRKLLPATAIN